MGVRVAMAMCRGTWGEYRWRCHVHRRTGGLRASLQYLAFEGNPFVGQVTGGYYEDSQTNRHRFTVVPNGGKRLIICPTPPSLFSMLYKAAQESKISTSFTSCSIIQNSIRQICS